MNFIDKVINLIKKTGGRCIVVDQDSKNTLVILTFEEYEKLLQTNVAENVAKKATDENCRQKEKMVEKLSEKELTEDKLLDKINRDIALKISEEKSFEESGGIGMLEEVPIEDGESEEKFYFEPIE